MVVYVMLRFYLLVRFLFLNFSTSFLLFVFFRGGALRPTRHFAMGSALPLEQLLFLFHCVCVCVCVCVCMYVCA